MKYKIGEIVDIDFGIAGRLHGYISGVHVVDEKIKYDITMKVGSVEEDLFTEIKSVDSYFVKISND